jgi:hypothetical protein
MEQALKNLVETLSITRNIQYRTIFSSKVCLITLATCPRSSLPGGSRSVTRTLSDELGCHVAREPEVGKGSRRLVHLEDFFGGRDGDNKGELFVSRDEKKATKARDSVSPRALTAHTVTTIWYSSFVWEQAPMSCEYSTNHSQFL